MCCIVGLPRFWIEFQAGVEPPAGCRLGCGVTAFSREDALALVREHVHEGNPLPAISRVLENVDVSTLDQNHVIPNMGDVTRRGIWFPQGNWIIKRW